MRAFLVVAFLATVAFCLISLLPQGGVAKYRYSFLFLIPILWSVFALRRALVLRPLHFALFSSALLLHDLGAFGWYQERVWVLEFDWCVHFVFGVVGGWIIARILAVRFALRGTARAVLMVLSVLGIGAIHEIVEAASTMVLGTEYGMLHVGPGNPFDTQQDLLANLLGAIAAIGITKFDPLLEPDGRA